MTTIRAVQPEDLDDLKAILNTIDLFPAEILEDMISDYFNHPESEDLWFTAVENDRPISIGYCAPEKLTNGTYNLYAIGVRSDIQSKGIGRQMMGYIEDELRNKGKRILIVDTSGSADFERTRQFYEQLNYQKEATIRDFWDEGDDKVVYYKKLN